MNNKKLIIIGSGFSGLSAACCMARQGWHVTVLEKHATPGGRARQLKDAGFITLNIDLIQMGVGGNDSWSDVAAPLEKYQIPAKKYQYSFYIVPFNAKEKSASERAKEIR